MAIDLWDSIMSAKTSKQTFIDAIVFLEWVQLHPDDVANLSMFTSGYHGRVFLSPDVHSLHIVWEEVGNDTPGEKVWHEIEDYDSSKTVSEFLDDAIFDDAQGPVGWTDDPFEAMSDFSKVTPESVRVVRLSELT